MSDERTTEEREQDRKEMADQVANPKTRHLFERLLRLASDKGEVDQVEERLSWGIDPDCRSPKRLRTPLIRSCTSYCPMANVVEVLLKHGADPSLMDDTGLSAIDYVRRRLIKYEGRPRKPIRKSPSILPNGDIQLSEHDHDMIDMIRENHPKDADKYELIYLEERRRAAEKVFDTRGELEKILPLLEKVEKKAR